MTGVLPKRFVSFVSNVSLVSDVSLVSVRNVNRNRCDFTNN